jgi:serine phosphatase RsbU (regulator of sigma subunit)
MAVRVPIGTRIFLTLVILFAVITVGIGILVSFTLVGTVERAVVGNIGRDTSLLAKDFETWLAEKYQILETLKHTVLQNRDDPEALLDILIAKTREEPDIAWIYYGTETFDPRFTPVKDGVTRTANGGYYVDADEWNPDPDFVWPSRPWFVRARDENQAVMSDPYIDANTKEIVVSLSRSVRDEGGRLLGVIALDMYISRLTEVVSVQKYTPSSKTYLIDAKGSFITHEDKSLVLKLDDPAGNLFSPGTPLAAMNEAILGTPETWSRNRGKNLYWAARRIPRTSWTVVTYGKYSDIARPVVEFYGTLLGIMGAAILMAVLFALAEARAISAPIEQLKRGALELAKGNLSWNVQIKSRDEFGELGDFFNQVAASLKENISRIEGQRQEIEDYSKNLEKMVEERTRQLDHANKELTARNVQMEKEMQMAEVVQRKTIPQTVDLPAAPELRFGARYVAMQAVGGDLYDVLPIDGRRYALLIADVSGHGMAAALVAAMAKVAFRTQAGIGLGPAEVCRAVNQEIHEIIGGETYYLSAFYLVLDVVDGTLTYSNAGHPPILLVRKDRTIEKLDVTGGQLLGISGDFAFEEGRTRMVPGDFLLMFTDGIVEARDPDGDFYEYGRLMEYIRGNRDAKPEEFIQGLLDDVDAFSRGAARSDDRAALYVQFNGYRSEATAAIAQAGDWSARLDRAGRLLKSGDARSASIVLEEIRAQRPEDPRVLNMLGLASFRLGDRERSERLLETAVLLAPESPTYRKNLEMVRAGKA